MLSKEQILGADDRKTVELEVPEWNGIVYLRMMSGRERDALEDSMQPGKNGKQNFKGFRSRFAALVLADETGKRLFTDAEAIQLGEKSAAALDRILDRGLEINGMSKDQVEEMAGNSKGDQNEDSGFD